MNNLSYSSIYTIAYEEVRHYFAEFQFNIVAPLINTLLFVLIISTIDKYYAFSNNSISYTSFLIPGMIMTVVIQTSFNHLSEVIISKKQIGSFDDYLISPISRIELLFSFILSSIIVCLVVALFNFIALSFFVVYEEVDYLKNLYYLVTAIIIFSCLGALTGFVSFTWDIQSFISNFFIVPISFLSGTFFTIDAIDLKLHFLFIYNPFLHLVRGFRGSFIEGIQIGYIYQIYIILVLLLSVILTIFVFKSGYKVIR